MINPGKPDYQNTPVSAVRPQFDYRPSDRTTAPAVTIVTPFFNAGSVFYETAESVFRQSLQQWEWLIINDGSTAPEALRILEDYRHKDDPCIRVVDHPRNKGLSAARNTGFQLAKADYVFQLDADDLIEPTTLEKMAWQLATNPNMAFVTGFTVGFGSLEYLWRNGFHSGNHFLEENLVTATCMVRKSVHRAIGGYEEEIRGGMEDWDFWLKAAAHGYWGTTIPEYMDWYRRRDSGREHWENLNQKDKSERFRAQLRQRYQNLWEGDFPAPAAMQPPLLASLPAELPFTNPIVKTKPRLLLIVPHFELGGADKFNLDLIRQLHQAQGWEVTVVTTRRTNDIWQHEFESLTPDVFVLHHFLDPVDYPRFLCYLIGSRRPDAVCVSNSRLGYQLLPYLRTHFPDLPVVDYLHMEEEAWGGGYPAVSVAYQSLLAQTVVSSQHLKDWMVKRGGDAQKIQVCHTNIDCKVWSRDRFDVSALAQKWGITRELPVLLYAGRICDQKQPKIFAQVMRNLARKHPGFVALVAGDGPDLPWLKAFLERERLHQVRLLGSIPNGAMAELLALSDIFFLPSEWEGISLALYEAMAMEVVPVAAEVGGQRELVTPECGFLVRHGASEVADYTNALERLLRSPELRKRMSAAGRRRLQERFDIKEMGARISTTLAAARTALAPGEWPRSADRQLATLSAAEVIEQMRHIEGTDLTLRQQQHTVAVTKQSVGWQSALQTAQALIGLDQRAAALRALQEGLKLACDSGLPEAELTARIEIAKALVPLDPPAAERSVLGAFPVLERLSDSRIRQKLKPALEECVRVIKNAPAPQRAAAIPTVSVVIPCYQQAHFLPEAVGSVLGQTFTDWEIIIVNDGSPDNTSEVARGLIARYPGRQIRLVEKTNGGLPSARNAGFQAACGKYVLPLDADDKIQPALLAKLVRILDAHPKVGFAYPHIQHFGATDTEFPLPDFDRETLVHKDNIACVCSLVRKAAWQQVGGYTETMREGYEDWDFWLGCVEHGWDGYCLHEPLFLYRKSGRSMLTDANQKRERLIAQIVTNHPGLYDERTRQWASQKLEQHASAQPPKSSSVPAAPVVAVATRPRLKITYLISSILGVTGGNQTLLRQAEEMRRRGHDVTIVTCTPKPDWFRFEMRVIHVPNGKSMASCVPPSDVVVATYFTNTSELRAVQAPVRVYYAQGDQFVFADATMAETERNRRIAELSRASYLVPGVRFVPNSNNLARAVERLCGRRADAILPVCTDQTIFRPLQRPALGLRPRLLIVGPDTRGSEVEPLLFKGIEDIRHALELLAQRGQQFTAVRMSGTPPDLFSRFPCEFYIRPSDEMKTVLFGTSHIHIYASHYDSCPRPPQEAMAAGCAVVCTATSGAMEYCRDGENCLLVPIKSPQAIAAAVERLIQEPLLREKLVQGGLATARQYPREREWDEWETMLYRFMDEAASKNAQPLNAGYSAPAQPPANRTAPTPLPLPPCAAIGSLDQARALVGSRDLPRAWKTAAEAIQLRPCHPEAYLLLAEIAQAGGDAASARLCAEQARRLAPDWKPARQFLKKALKGNTRPDWLLLPERLQDKAAGKPKSEGSNAPRLTVCLIAKNEEQFLAQCLKSVKDLAWQIVVVDTGSTDKTVEIAKKFGAEVHHFDWCDDFSAARNAALEHARGDWILILDADEELPAEQHARLRGDLKSDKALALRLPLVNRGQEAEGRTFVPRLFRNAPGVFFHGRIHEQVFPSLVPLSKSWGLTTDLGSTQLLHHGYSAELTKDRNKVERNLRLLRQAVAEDPTDANLAMSLGLELVRSDDLADGLEQYRRAFQLMSAQRTADVVPELREALLTQFTCHLYKIRAHDEVVSVLSSPLATKAGLTASLHFALGLAQFELQNYSAAAEQMRQCLAKRNQPGLAPINTDVLTAAPHHCLAMCLSRLGDAAGAEKAFQAGLTQTGRTEELRLDYVKFLLEQNRPVDALHRLHESVANNALNAEAWHLGAKVALSRPEFLEFARDWTAEAIRYLPKDSVVLDQRAEALLFNGESAPARELWARVWQERREPQAFAAMALCDLLAGTALQTPDSESEALEASRAFIALYQKCLAVRASDIVATVNNRVSELRSALPLAATMLEAALAEANEPEPACVGADTASW